MREVRAAPPKHMKHEKKEDDDGEPEAKTDGSDEDIFDGRKNASAAAAAAVTSAADHNYDEDNGNNCQMMKVVSTHISATWCGHGGGIICSDGTAFLPAMTSDSGSDATSGSDIIASTISNRHDSSEPEPDSNWGSGTDNSPGPDQCKHNNDTMRRTQSFPLLFVVLSVGVVAAASARLPRGAVSPSNVLASPVRLPMGPPPPYLLPSVTRRSSQAHTERCGLRDAWRVCAIAQGEAKIAVQNLRAGLSNLMKHDEKSDFEDDTDGRGDDKSMEELIVDGMLARIRATLFLSGPSLLRTEPHVSHKVASKPKVGDKRYRFFANDADHHPRVQSVLRKTLKHQSFGGRGDIPGFFS